MNQTIGKFSIYCSHNYWKTKECLINIWLLYQFLDLSTPKNHLFQQWLSNTVSKYLLNECMSVFSEMES